jgi:hypothetical protein
MPINEKLIEQVKAILIERSKKAIELSKQAFLEEQIKYEPLREALRYFMAEIWYDASHSATSPVPSQRLHDIVTLHSAEPCVRINSTSIESVSHVQGPFM